MSDEPDSATPEPEGSVWPPPPTPQEREPAPVPPRQGLDWAAFVPGAVVVLFLLLCFLITLWFLGRLEHL